MYISIAIAVVFLAVIIGAFLFHENMAWEKFAKQALSTRKCPFCGRRLDKYTFQGDEGLRDVYFCKACDFSVSAENHELVDVNPGTLSMPGRDLP